MTEEYKERIIKYLTNNYNKDISPDKDAYIVEDTTLLTLEDNFNDYFDTIQGYIQGKDGKGNDLDLGFVYGVKNNKGIIAIVDSLFNIVQVIDEYNTGTDFNQWICLNIDVTNGNLYGIDKQGNNTRFILLNNFLIKTPAQQNYEVKLRSSYMITLPYNAKWVEKSPSASFYAIIGTDNNNELNISTYKIEVGSSNELKNYTMQGALIPTVYPLDYTILWSGENYTIKVGSTNTSQVYTEYELSDTDQYIQSGTIVNMNLDILNIKMTNTKFYLMCEDVYGGSTFVMIYKYEYSVGYAQRIYSQSLTNFFDYTSYSTLMFKKNNTIFATINILLTNSKYQYITGVIDNTFNELSNTNGNFVCFTSDEINSGSLMQNQNLVFNVITNYNLLTYSMIGKSNRKIEMKQVFNDNEWHYVDYQDYNSMVPTSGLLYDEDDNVIFARNLYNKVVNGNITTSTLEVPNMLLNDIPISQQDLLGATNGILVSETDDITKNIYEDLFINFINTLTMQDQNTQDYIYNLNGATRLNASISNTADYTSATLNKIRINYTDNTSYVKSISKAIKISQFVYQYAFNVYVTKSIANIELISNDTLTTYQTIDGSIFELNKAYKITQNVEIQ